jgi:hypothetical protein
MLPRHTPRQVRLVLQRGASEPPVWYLAGKEGIASSNTLLPTQRPIKVGGCVCLVVVVVERKGVGWVSVSSSEEGSRMCPQIR